ncbi:MAG: glycine betaine/proline transport system ATP-binding protein [Clostridia bacterium]|nr:glycine betaine/proline transport system ATP-binding protein [Clostridia bacterium]
MFGDNPGKAIELLDQGFSKVDILARTNQTVAVADVSFDIQEGEIFVLMGLSGSGKSTILRCLNRLIEPTRGHILLDGEDITTYGEKQLREVRRKKLGMVFQQFALFPHRTVLENAAYGLEVQGVPRQEREEQARAVLETVGLKGWEKAYPRELSGGMQQRVGLARALVCQPDVLLMDEAFSGLDPLIRREMQNELLALQSQVNKTIVFVTHDLDEALKLGDRIALLKDGAIQQIGTPEEILMRPANEYVAKFVEGVDVSKVLTAEGVMKKPLVVLSLKDGPHVALRVMRENGLSSLFVVDRVGRLVGLVTAEAAFGAVERGQHDLASILVREVPTALPETPVSELIEMLAEAKYPVAVTDPERKLVGVVVKGAVLAGLAKKARGIEE